MIIKRMFIAATFVLLFLLSVVSSSSASVVETLTPVNDTYISSTDSLNHSTDWVLVTGTAGGTSVLRSLIRFNINLPSNSVVQSARLKLTGNSSAASNVAVHAIRSDWADSSIVFPGPAFETDAYATKTINMGAPAIYEWDVTSLVAKWTRNEIPNLGLLLKNTNEGVISVQQFTSSDNPPKPLLEITYDIVPPSPPTPTPAPGATTPAPATQQKILSTLLSLSAKPKVIKTGKAVLIKGEIRDINGMPVKNKQVNIRGNGKLIKQAVTNSMGLFQFKHKPKKSTKYTAAFAGDSSYQATSSKAVKVKVNRVKKKAKKKKKIN